MLKLSPQITAFLAQPWQPLLYTDTEISYRLHIHIQMAAQWVRMINGDNSPRVTHHDLVELIKDQNSISAIPTSPQQLPLSGRWLVEERGWSFTTSYEKYRWIDTQTSLRHTLRVALKIELDRLYSTPTSAQDIVIEYSPLALE
jgi:hypothetical protein